MIISESDMKVLRQVEYGLKIERERRTEDKTMWIQLNVPKPLDERIKLLAERKQTNEHEIIVDLLIKATDKIWENKTW